MSDIRGPFAMEWRWLNESYETARELRNFSNGYRDVAPGTELHVIR
jgi:hypothetical protein